MNQNYLPVRKKYMAYFCGFLLLGLTITSCKLPTELSGTDTVKVAKNFAHVPDTTQEKLTLLKWHDFFRDTLLVALIDSALRDNLDLKSATQRIFKAQAGYNFSRNAYYPNLNAKAGFGITKYGDYTENGVGNFDTNLSSNITEDQKIPAPALPEAFLGLQTSWEIGFAGKLSNQKKGTYYNHLSTQNGRQFVQTQVVANVARLYY